MSLNVIDISNWQRGLDLSVLFSRNPDLDGVVVKSTGGVSNVQATCDPWVQWLMENNKAWGFYHFLDDDYKNSSGRAEAEFWVKNTKSYFGFGIPFADYENPAKSLGTRYLKEFLDTVYELTGVKPGVYASLSVVQSQDFSAIASAGYPLWLAQYANYNPTGFQPRPWQNGSYAPFKKYIMHQYTSSGELKGWGSRLDLDLFTGDRAEWDALAKGDVPAPPGEKHVNPQIVMSILNGDYGIGQERVNRLVSEGYDPSEVQSKINELYGVALGCRDKFDGNMEYMDSIVKIIKSI